MGYRDERPETFSERRQNAIAAQWSAGLEAADKLSVLKQVNAQLVAALERLLSAYAADVEKMPEMTVLMSYETNTQAINQARAALAAAKKGA